MKSQNWTETLKKLALESIMKNHPEANWIHKINWDNNVQFVGANYSQQSPNPEEPNIIVTLKLVGTEKLGLSYDKEYDLRTK